MYRPQTVGCHVVHSAVICIQTLLCNKLFSPASVQQRHTNHSFHRGVLCLFTCASDHVRLGHDVCGALAFSLDKPVAAGNPLTGVFVCECQQERVRQTASCPRSSCWSLVLVNTLHGKPVWDGHWWLAPTDTWLWPSVSRDRTRFMISADATAVSKANCKVDLLTRLNKTAIYKVSHTLERARSVCALRGWVHSNNPMVNVLLSGSQRGSLTMCTFRTQSLTAALSLWRKAWNVSRRQTRAALKGISITSAQAGPYVMVTSLRDAFLDWCSAPSQHAPSWKSTGTCHAPPRCNKVASFTFV